MSVGIALRDFQGLGSDSDVPKRFEAFIGLWF